MTNVVFLTETAKEHMSKMLEENNKPAIKLALQGGGCAGFKYDWSLEDEAETGDEVIELDNGKFIIDSMSVMYLLGSTVDYKTELFGSYFDIRNPSSTSSCGCGESVGF
jgi:iron-sulfur cluster assembly accessory protein